MKTYKGNPYLTFEWWMCWLLATCPIWLQFLVTKWLGNFGTYLAGLVLVAIGAFFYSYQLHYFLLHNGQLVVRNHIWFWRKHIYPLKDIQKVELYQNMEFYTSLRITLANKKRKKYYAESLKDKDWTVLLEDLQKAGITT